MKSERLTSILVLWCSSYPSPQGLLTAIMLPHHQQWVKMAIMPKLAGTQPLVGTHRSLKMQQPQGTCPQSSISSSIKTCQMPLQQGHISNSPMTDPLNPFSSSQPLSSNSRRVFSSRPRPIKPALLQMLPSKAALGSFWTFSKPSSNRVWHPCNLADRLAQQVLQISKTKAIFGQDEAALYAPWHAFESVKINWHDDAAICRGNSEGAAVLRMSRECSCS